MYLLMMFDRNKLKLNVKVYSNANIEDILTMHLKEYDLAKYRHNKHASRNAADHVKFNNYEKVIKSLAKDDLYIEMVELPYNSVTVSVLFDNYLNEFIYYINKEPHLALQTALAENKIFNLGNRLETLDIVSKSKFVTDKVLVYSNIFCSYINNINNEVINYNTYLNDLFEVSIDTEAASEFYISIYDKTYNTTLELLLAKSTITAYRDTYTEIAITNANQLSMLLDRSPIGIKDKVFKSLPLYNINLN